MTKARVKLEQFGGEIPRVGDRLLPPTHATIAKNVKLKSGEIRGIRQLKLLHDYGTLNVAKSYRLPDPTQPDGYTWLGLDSVDTTVIRGPLLNDKYDRYYMFGNGVPKYNTLERIRNGAPWIQLGVVAPAQKPNISVGGGHAPDEERWYVYTYVTEYGEEGPPSDPVTATGKSDGTWNLSNLDTTPPVQSGDTTSHSKKIRIYRTVPGYTTAEFFFVAEIPITQATYSDSIADDVVARNNLLESTTWNPPPRNLEGAVVMPNGFFIAWENDNIHFSETYRPHAWPPAYDLGTEFEVIGAGVFGQSAGIVTKGTPYIATGATPEGVTLTKMATAEPGLNKHSIVDLTYGVLYASQNGLVLLDHSGVKIATASLITKKEWLNDYAPHNLIAAQYETEYVGFYSPDDGFIIDPQEAQAAFVQTDDFVDVSYISTDFTTGEVLVDKGGKVYLWDSQDQPRRRYTWRSKVFDFPQPCNLGAARVEFLYDAATKAELEAIAAPWRTWNAQRIQRPLNTIGSAAFGGATQAPNMTTVLPQNRDALGGSPLINVDKWIEDQLRVRFNVYAEDELVYSELVHSGVHLRLPSGFKARHWMFEVIGHQTVYSIKVAETGKGLADV